MPHVDDASCAFDVYHPRQITIPACVRIIAPRTARSDSRISGFAAVQEMTTPGVEPGLSRPQRDVLTTRRCGPCRCGWDGALHRGADANPGKCHDHRVRMSLLVLGRSFFAWHRLVLAGRCAVTLPPWAGNAQTPAHFLSLRPACSWSLCFREACQQASNSSHQHLPRSIAARPPRPARNTHRGARTHDHKVKSLALYRLS